ncbi:hypothetical protein C1645_557228 [Glomus cerebriforme]|uniref:DUF7431 domain-containing protein n=1 Tax=Glomus cerebriforme TaxID=658196 RepID=A0A397TL94_9GLOM|nr:hypothetical protein C1645_557228 [Glomus cerebriforme]
MMPIFYYTLKNIIGDNARSTKVADVIVQIEDSPRKLVHLNLHDKLSKVRLTLKNRSINVDTLLFAKKENEVISEMPRVEEEERSLKDIVGRDNILYLKKDSEPDIPYLCNRYKLGYGLTFINDEFKEANEAAFEILDCKMNYIDNKHKENKYEINTDENLTMIKNSLFAADVQEFAKFGLEDSKNKKYKNVTNSTYIISEYGKVSLKLELKPSKKFIEAVKDAINSNEPRKLKEITDKFGQFIPSEVILGGRYLIEKIKTLRECSQVNSVEAAAGAGYQGTNITMRKKFIRMLSDKKFSDNLEFELIGGKQFGYEGFNEEEWLNTLVDFRTWEIIKFKEPKNIFKYLPSDLRKQILALVGKKIIYSKVENIPIYKLKEPGESEEIGFNIPDDKLDIFYNKEADCNIFATVIDRERVKKDFFMCHILCSKNELPSLIIHCIQKKFKKRECNLRLKWMIIGYDISFNFNNYANFNVQLKVKSENFIASNNRTQYKKSLLDLKNRKDIYIGIPVIKSKSSIVIGHHFFNDQVSGKIGSYIFSYCNEKNHYVDLPDFTFHTLIISNHHKCGILNFKQRNKIRNVFVKPKPKFISLCSPGEDICGPVFLKQKVSKIKKMYIDHDNCERGDKCVCKNNLLKKSDKGLMFAYFSPTKHDNLKID